MIRPVLPGAERASGLLKGKVDYVLVDRMKPITYADWVYLKYGLERRYGRSLISGSGQELALL